MRKHLGANPIVEDVNLDTFSSLPTLPIRLSLLFRHTTPASHPRNTPRSIPSLVQTPLSFLF